MGKSGVDGRDVREDGDDEDGGSFKVNFGTVLVSMLLLSVLNVALTSELSPI